MHNQTENTDPNKKSPDFHIHVKVPNGEETIIASRIGVGFYHQNKKGINIILDAQPIPLDGKIELVGFTTEEKS